MKRLVLTVQLVMLAVTCAVADPVGRSQAMETASAFLQERGQVIGTATTARRLSPAKSSESDGLPYYVFNASDGGYVIVSGESTTQQIIGYADQGTFEYDEAPEGLKDLLAQYAEQVSLIQSGLAKAASVSTEEASWATVAPMITTTWNQSSPYNYYMSSGYVTGCVATAMAQLMNYWECPASACGEIPAYTSSTGVAYDALAATTFNWTNMLDSYSGSYTDDEAKAVGLLMEYAGHSVQMTYGTTSGAAASLIPSALSSYFGYDDEAVCIWRDSYSTADWHDMIYHELSNGRPMEYSAFSEEGSGHSFVCDGFQEGYYHINWGWGGSLDGYFLLELMETGEGGIGGNGTYTYSQGAVVNIAPDGKLTDPIELPNFEPVSMYMEDDKVIIKCLQYGDIEDYPYIMFAVYNEAGNLCAYAGIGTIAIGSNEVYYQCPTSDITNYIGTNYSQSTTDATYTLTPIYYSDQSNVFSDGTYLKLVYDADGAATATVLPELESTTVELVSASEKLFVNYAGSVTFSFTNPNDSEVNDVYVLRAIKDGATHSETTMQVYLSAGETEETTFYYTPSATGKVSYQLYNSTTGKVVWEGDTEYTIYQYMLAVKEYEFVYTSSNNYYTLTATFHNNSSEDDLDSNNYIAWFENDSDESSSTYKYADAPVEIAAGGDVTLTFKIYISSYSSGDKITIWFTNQYGQKVAAEKPQFVLGEESSGVYKTIGDAGYSSFSAAYNVTVPSGVTAYTARLSDDATLVNLTDVSATVIPADNGVILSGTAGETYLFESTSTSAALRSDNQLIASTDNTSVDGASSTDYTYYALRANKATFGKIGANLALPLNSAVLRVDKDSSAAASLGIILEEEDATVTAITELPTSETADGGAIYNIAGQRVNSTLKGGIYIQNGRKFIAK